MQRQRNGEKDLHYGILTDIIAHKEARAEDELNVRKRELSLREEESKANKEMLGALFKLCNTMTERD